MMIQQMMVVQIKLLRIVRVVLLSVLDMNQVLEYPKNEPIPYDYDKWLQCYNCGTIVPRVHAKQENEISPIVEPSGNIHDAANKVVVLGSNAGRAHRRSKAIIDYIKKTRPGASRGKDYVDVNPDLRVQLQKGKQLVSYQSTNDEFEG